MTTINTNNAKTELISTLRDSNQRVTEWFMEIPADTFFIRQRAENIADGPLSTSPCHSPGMERRLLKCQ